MHFLLCYLKLHLLSSVSVAIHHSRSHHRVNLHFQS